MNCCKITAWAVLLLVLWVVCLKAYNFYDDLTTHLRREAIVDEYPSQYGEIPLWNSLRYYQDPCLLYHRNHYLYNMALEHNWTRSIELAHEIIRAKYPESSRIGPATFQLCGFICSPHSIVDCSAGRQWGMITEPGYWGAYNPD